MIVLNLGLVIKFIFVLNYAHVNCFILAHLRNLTPPLFIVLHLQERKTYVLNFVFQEM